MPLPLPHRQPGDETTTRRRLLVAAAATAAGAYVRQAGFAGAQGDAAATAEAGEVAPIAPGPSAIVSTGRGEAPTYGGTRPGPFNQPPAQRQTLPGVAPTGLRVERVGIDAAIEDLRIVDGQMQDPTGPWIVGWYTDLGWLGRGNVVMAGHIDYWNVGPSVFFDIAALEPGDLIDVLGDDGQDYGFLVEWVRQVNADDAPLEELVGSTGGEALTLITCGGTFDYQNGVYLQRTVVRAGAERAAAAAIPESTAEPTADPTPNPNPPIVPRATLTPPD